MAKRLPEIELEEIQELKENAKKEHTKKKHKNLFLRGRHVFYASKATGSDQMQQKLSSLSRRISEE